MDHTAISTTGSVGAVRGSIRAPRSAPHPSNPVDGLLELLEQVGACHLYELETMPTAEVRRAAPRIVHTLLREAVSTFDGVLTSTRVAIDTRESLDVVESDEDSLSFLEEVDRTIEVSSSIASADIAFIARLEMQSLERELDSIAPTWDGWKIIELCERIRRHIIKAATALRRTLGQEVGSTLARDEVYVTELVRSIQVRRRHASFRRQIHDAELKHPDAPLPRLRLAGTSIAMLICRREYGDFRIGDRMLIREIQRSILEYLRAPERSRTDGERIWQDIRGALEITRQINNRPELLEHDALILETLAAALEPASPEGRLDALVDQAQAVIGRDDALDRLIVAGAPVSAPRWRAAVDAAREALLQHHVPQSAHEEILEATSRSGVWDIPALS